MTYWYINFSGMTQHCSFDIGNLDRREAICGRYVSSNPYTRPEKTTTIPKCKKCLSAIDKAANEVQS